MTERPILFSAPMVRAILDGRKTQTRRVVRGVPEGFAPFGNSASNGALVRVFSKGGTGFTYNGFGAKTPNTGIPVRSPYGVPGDRLWVKETHHYDGCTDDGRPEVYFRADGGDFAPKKWTPSIFMPRSLSRLTLEVTEVRVQRLQDISEEDAEAEGIYAIPVAAPAPIHTETRWTAPGVVMTNNHGEREADVPCHRTATNAYATLWDSINGKRPGCSWADNPWVWVVMFRRLA